jgi:hypothetical protein
MKKIILLIVWFACVACNQTFEPVRPLTNATIINFCEQKAYCQYGYMLIVGSDTMLSSSYVISEKIGFNIQIPVKVLVKFHRIDEFCHYPYCEVDKLEILN